MKKAQDLQASDCGICLNKNRDRNNTVLYLNRNEWSWFGLTREILTVSHCLGREQGKGRERKGKGREGGWGGKERRGKASQKFSGKRSVLLKSMSLKWKGFWLPLSYGKELWILKFGERLNWNWLKRCYQKVAWQITSVWNILGGMPGCLLVF